MRTNDHGISRIIHFKKTWSQPPSAARRAVLRLHVVQSFLFFDALSSTNSMYSAIVYYITKTFHMPQEGTKEREKNNNNKNTNKRIEGT